MNLLHLFAFLTVAHAQYFSEGWAPGKEANTQPASVPQSTYVPGTPAPPSAAVPANGGFLDRVLSSGPFPGIFEKLGVNISERIEQAAALPWDPRVPLITDDNYGDMIVNETLTEEEEKTRVWVIVVTVTAAKQDGVSKFLDDVFDSAYNKTQLKGDLPNVRWGRVDYLNVTAITTKWALWQAPYIVVLTDRGQTLRFYKAHQLRLKEDSMRMFLELEGWRETEPWRSMYAPGGSREWMMDYLAYVLTKSYNFFIIIPKWLLLIVSGGVASLAINLMHRAPKPKPAPAVTQKSVTPAGSPLAASATSGQTTASPSKRSAKARKNKK
jgi:hypothetical protein